MAGGNVFDLISYAISATLAVTIYVPAAPDWLNRGSLRNIISRFGGKIARNEVFMREIPHVSTFGCD
jgi:hypothetical protein